MADTPGDESAPFQVVLSRDISDKVKQLAVRAKGRGLGTAFLATITSILQSLQTHPISFGDPQWSLHEMRLQIFRRVMHPVTIWYGVQVEKKLVFVSSVDPFPMDSY